MDEEDLQDTFEQGWGVMLDLDPDTRVWELRARGTAAMLMFLLMDVTDTSLISKLMEEAKFDQVMKNYDVRG